MDTFNENVTSELTKLIEALPSFKELNINIPLYNFENDKSLHYQQAFINNLVNLFQDEKLKYSHLSNQVSENISNLEAISNNPYTNLLLNLRSKFSENLIRYLFGYIPKQLLPYGKYYNSGNIFPTSKKNNESDFLFIPVQNYNNFIIPSELISIKSANNSNTSLLLCLPILLKHFEHYRPYLTDVSSFKQVLLQELSALKCTQYYQLVNINIQEPIYEDIIENINSKNKQDYFYILLAYFIDTHMNIHPKTALSSNDIGFMIYELCKNHNLCQFGIDFGSIKEEVNFTLGQETPVTLKTITWRPAVPVKPLITDYPIKKVIINKNPMKNTTPVSNNAPLCLNNTYIDTIKNQLKKTGRYLWAGERHVSFETEFQTPKIINSQTSPVNSSEELSNFLFQKFTTEYRCFFCTPEYQQDIESLYQLLQENNHSYAEYLVKGNRYNGFIIDSDIADDQDQIIIAKIYDKYFNILRNLANFLNINNQKIPDVENNFILLANMLISQIDNFGHHTLQNLSGIRQEIDGFYKLLSKIQNSDICIKNIHRYIIIVLDSFKQNYIQPFLGGTGAVKMYDGERFNSFFFFNYVYLVEIFAHNQYDSVAKSEYYEMETCNANLETKAVNYFWDGVPYETFITYDFHQKMRILALCYHCLFIQNSTYSQVYLTKNPEIKPERVCLLAKNLGKYSSYDIMKKISLQVESDNINEIDLQKFLMGMDENLDHVNIGDFALQFKNIDSVKKALGLLEYHKNTDNVTENNSFYVLYIFLFQLFSALGFDTQQILATSNLSIKIKPAFNRENIMKNIKKKYTGSEKDLSILEGLIQSNEKILKYIEDHVRVTVDYIGDEDPKAGQKSLTDDTESTLLFNITDDNVLANIIKTDKLYPNQQQSLKDISQTIYDLNEWKSAQDFQQRIQMLVNNDDVTATYLYRLVPGYIKDQMKLLNHINISDFFINTSSEKAGSDKVLKSILTNIDKYNTDNLSNLNDVSKQNNVSDATINRQVNMIMNEKYLPTLSRLIPYYDTKIAQLGTVDKNFTLLKNTINTIDFLRNNYKMDMQTSIKEGIIQLYKQKENIDLYIYRLFLVVRFIKSICEDIYRNINITPKDVTLSFTEFEKFNQLIEKNMLQRTKQLSQLSKDRGIETYIRNKLNLKQISNLDEYNFFSFSDFFNPATQTIDLTNTNNPQNSDRPTPDIDSNSNSDSPQDQDSNSTPSYTQTNLDDFANRL